MKIIGRGSSLDAARRDARKQASDVGLVVLCESAWRATENEYRVPVTAVRPGWLMRDVTKAAERVKQMRAQEPSHD